MVYICPECKKVSKEYAWNEVTAEGFKCYIGSIGLIENDVDRFQCSYICPKCHNEVRGSKILVRE